MAEEYISLKEATKYCPYSQDYLKLRARQGKLKALKFGRNWVTTKEWLREYLREFSIFNSQFSRTNSQLPQRKGEGARKETQQLSKKLSLSGSRMREYFLFIILVIALIMGFIILEAIMNFKPVESILEKIIPARTIEIR